MHTSFSSSSVKELLTPSIHQGHKTAVKVPSSKTGNVDAVSIGILTPEKTQAILNRQIADKLEARFKEEGIELTDLSPDDFTPEKVSERILGFVSGRILSEQDKAKQSELMEQARAGIEQGFSEARDILESLDVLNGKVKEDVDSTYDLIQQGLERLQQQIDGTLVEQDKEDEVSVAQLQQASMEHGFSRNENTRVEIITREGDSVLIDLFKQQSGQSSHRISQTENGSSFSVTRSLSASTGISYQVQGDLDEDEQQAIDKLLKDVAKVSENFFSGNVQNTFKKAIQLDFDSEEITHFSLNLDYQETRQVAISTYSQYQSQSRENSPENPAQADVKEMSDFVKQMDQLFRNPLAQNKFAHPAESVAELFKTMNELLYSDKMEKLEQDSSSLLDSLVQQLKQTHSQPSVSPTEKQEVISS